MNKEYPLKTVATFFLLGMALIVIPITVFLAQREQETRARAAVASEDTVVAVINGKQITKAQVRLVAEEQYEPIDVNDQELKDALVTIEEREILDNAENTYNIRLDNSWVDELRAYGYPENEAHYEVLKNQVVLQAVNSRAALTIQFWNTPDSGLDSLSKEEKAKSAKELVDGTSALEQAQTDLTSNKDILEIGDALLTKYPSLRTVLAVNGNILDGLTQPERTAAKHPQVYEFGDSGLDQETQDLLFSMSVNDVNKITNTTSNKGGIVFKLLSANDNGANTYDEWYQQQMTSLVKDLGVL